MTYGSDLENKIREAVRSRLRRGERDECAAAAGHKGPWLSKWMSGDLHATIDELVGIARFLRIPLMKLMRTGDLDLHALALYSKIESLAEPQRRLAVRYVDRLAGGEDDVVIPRSFLEQGSDLGQIERKAAGKRKGA